MEVFRLLGSIFIDNEKANRGIDDTDKRGKNLGKTFGGMIGTVGKWALAAGAAAGTAAIAFGGIATKAAMDFEQQMANVATLLDGDVKTKIGNLGENVKQLSKDTGTSTARLTDGLYQVISAFGESEESMQILQVAAKGAAAGNATVTDSVNLLAAVTKGYGDTSEEAAKKASDLAFLTVKLGQTSFPELASSMGKVIPLASTMKVKQEELFGAMATLTGVTGGTAEVTTQLRATIQGFLQPTKDMSEALKKLGYSNGQAAIESEGLGGILDKLKESVGGNEIAFSQLFGSVEAKNAVLALTGAQADNFREKTEAMKDAVGATNEAFERQQATVAATMGRIRAHINTVTISVGEKLLPIFEKALNWVLQYMPKVEQGIDKGLRVAGVVINDYVLPALDDFKAWVEPYLPLIQDLFSKAFNKGRDYIMGAVDAIRAATKWAKDHWSILEPILAGILGGVVAFKLITGAIALYKAAVATATAVKLAFAAATTAALAPIYLVVLAIGALIAIGVLLWRNWDSISAWLKESWTKIGAWFGGLVDSIKEKFFESIERVKNIFRDFLALIRGIFTGDIHLIIESFWHFIYYLFGEKMANFLTGILEWFIDSIAVAIAKVKAIVAGWLDIWKKLFSGDFRGALEAFWKYIETIFGEKIAGAFKGFIKNAVQWGKDLIQGLIDGVTGMAGKAVESVQNVGKGIANGLKKFFGISSPSKLFDTFGVNLGQGLIQGVARITPDVNRAAMDMAEVAVPDFPPNPWPGTPRPSSPVPQASAAPVYQFGANSVNITIDASKIKDLQDLLDIFSGLEQLARAGV